MLYKETITVLRSMKPINTVCEKNSCISNVEPLSTLSSQWVFKWLSNRATAKPIKIMKGPTKGNKVRDKVQMMSRFMNVVCFKTYYVKSRWLYRRIWQISHSWINTRILCVCVCVSVALIKSTEKRIPRWLLQLDGVIPPIHHHSFFVSIAVFTYVIRWH